MLGNAIAVALLVIALLTAITLIRNRIRSKGQGCCGCSKSCASCGNIELSLGKSREES